MCTAPAITVLQFELTPDQLADPTHKASYLVIATRNITRPKIGTILTEDELFTPGPVSPEITVAGLLTHQPQIATPNRTPHAPNIL